MVAGFAHAPITKSILILTTVLTILASLFQLKPYIHLQLFPHVSTHHQYYRLLTQHVAFTNSSELLLALLLFYNAGVKVERTFGTYKFAGFLVVTTALYTAAQVVVLGVGSLLLGWMTGSSSSKSEGWVSNGRGPAGPLAPLFAILYQYHCIIPPLWSIQVGHLTLTDQHIATYSLALLLAISQASSTLFCALLAIAVSALYRTTALQHYRVPMRLYRIAALLIAPWIGSTRLPQRSWRAEPPVRRTREARQARLAEHNAAVAQLNREGGIGMPRLASLLRRRTTAAAPTVLPQQQAATTPGTAAPAALTPAASAAGQGPHFGWNDVPPLNTASEQRQ